MTDVLKPRDRVVCLQENVDPIWFISEGLINLTYWDQEGRKATLLLLDPDDGGVHEGIENALLRD